MKEVPQNVSDAVKRLNPHLYPPLGGLPAQDAKRPPDKALERSNARGKKGKSRVECRVTLIACRRRELDDDNNIGSLKQLRDAIASATLHIDDRDKRVRWEYGQVLTQGKECVLVKIEKVL